MHGWGVSREDDTDVCRLFNGATDGVPGLIAERFGHVRHLWTDPEQFTGGSQRATAAAKCFMHALHSSTVYHKTLAKRRLPVDEEKSELGSKPLLGEAVVENVVVRENGLKFLIRPNVGYATGLFLNGARIAVASGRLAAGRRVLNTFAYTCGFSVAAAIGGAATTVAWIFRLGTSTGVRNFEAATASAAATTSSIRSEVFDYLTRARRQERRLD